MRKEIHNALRFSHEFVGQVIDLDNCPHQGFFDHHDRRCIECEQSLECEWLTRDMSSSPAQKPLLSLIRNLESAICHIDSHLSRQGHDLSVCRCDGCAWLREAEGLFEQAAEYKFRH